MRVVYVEPGKSAEIKEIKGSLKGMQELVGGYIQALYPFEDSVALICNEEGKLLNLPFNRLLISDQGEPYDIVCGNFFICMARPGKDNFESLPDDLLKKYLKLYEPIELFVETKTGIRVMIYRP